jgi:hypothetical protein
VPVFLSIFGIFIILAVLWDGFETMVLPRRVTRRFRFARLFYRSTWRAWSLLLHAIPSNRGRETYRGLFGPMTLLLLLCTWAAGLVVGFSLLYLASGKGLSAPGGHSGFGEALYMSGTTFFTLGLGDVVPASTFARALTVIEAGMGFGFLAILIGHLPALNQSFSNREVNISLLDARAGSPPTAFEILYRHSHDYGTEALRQLLYDWERWSAELLESHLSFPVLAYYRSQHDNQSWLAALTSVLDVSALIITGLKRTCEHQAELTFAMARHVVVDLAFVFNTPRVRPSATAFQMKIYCTCAQLWQTKTRIFGSEREQTRDSANCAGCMNPMCILSHNICTLRFPLGSPTTTGAITGREAPGTGSGASKGGRVRGGSRKSTSNLNPSFSVNLKSLQHPDSGQNELRYKPFNGYRAKRG